MGVHMGECSQGRHDSDPIAVAGVPAFNAMTKASQPP
jgi:hypothetical protein